MPSTDSHFGYGFRSTSSRSIPCFVSGARAINLRTAALYSSFCALYFSGLEVRSFSLNFGSGKPTPRYASLCVHVGFEKLGNVHDILGSQALGEIIAGQADGMMFVHPCFQFRRNS